MKLAEAASYVAERFPLPDAMIRAGVAALVSRTDRDLSGADAMAEDLFARDMDNYPIAIHTDAANAQHYEVPAAFFEHVLGPRRKYSSCFYAQGSETLAAAEDEALALTAAHAALADGQTILELGCGWGSLSLYMAQRYPHARITCVSNSNSQRAFIEQAAQARGLTNVNVITCDMNDFAPAETFDRVVSVEMFEHMANWRALLGKVKHWLQPDGRLFIHIFTHHAAPYRFDSAEKADWIAQHFFTGGIMPSHGLMNCFPDLFKMEAEWRWSGTHYARTARQWLENFDANIALIMPILQATYGADAALWKRRWRMFFLATEGLFGHAGGQSWGISHYRLAPA